MGIISVIQVLIKQAADGLGAVIAHIRRLVFYWAWCIHKVRTQLITADTLPAWNSALMSLLLFTHIPTPAAVSVFTPVWTCMKLYHPYFATYDSDACVFPWKPYQVNSL